MTVDVDKFSQKCAQLPNSEDLKAENDLAGKKLALFVGRFTDVKNLPLLLQAATLLKQKRQDFALCLVGKGEEKPKLEGICNANDLQQIVRFVDYTLPDRLASYYKMADVLVLPSKFEQWGLVVNEALACGVPVIASNRVGSVDDLIICGENGDVFSWNSTQELADLLEKWLYAKTKETIPDVMKTWNHQTYKEILSGILMEIRNETNN